MVKRSIDHSLHKSEKVFSEYLFQSDFYDVKNWSYDFNQDKVSTKGYNDCLCVVIVRHGDFLFDLSSRSYDMHTGHILIDKPDYEYGMRPAAGICSIVNFTRDFYHQLIDDLNLHASFFFGNPNQLSLLLSSNPELDYLHYQIVHTQLNADKLNVDQLVLELLMGVIHVVHNQSVIHEVDHSLKRFHTVTVEKAKEYIHQNFSKNISLQEISSHCCVSLFHFGRIFKAFTSCTPYSYLKHVRLKHGEMLLRNTKMSVGEIAAFTGFGSPEHFATAFKAHYHRVPTEYRS